MAKTLAHKKLLLKLPIINLEHPLKFNRPVVVIAEEEYNELLEDLQDLRDALKAEEEFLASGGKDFKEYDSKRRSKK